MTRSGCFSASEAPASLCIGTCGGRSREARPSMDFNEPRPDPIGPQAAEERTQRDGPAVRFAT